MDFSTEVFVMIPKSLLKSFIILCIGTSLTVRPSIYIGIAVIVAAGVNARATQLSIFVYVHSL